MASLVDALPRLRRRGARRKGRGADIIQTIALVCAVLLAGGALLAPWLTPFDPLDQSLLARLRPPIGFDRYSAGHLAGTDELGRDVLSRSLHGLRLTLALAFAGAVIGLLLGGLLGLIAGQRRGWVEDGIMSLVDMQIAIPFTLVALLVLALMGSSLTVLVLVLGIAGWEQYARIVRGEVRRIAAQPYLEAAHTAGAGPFYIAWRHVLPNLVSPLVVQFTLSLSNIVILESTLSFLGLGVQPPQPSLGSMVGLGRDYMPTAPWIVLTPAALIVVLTFTVQILGDWLRDRADVRLRER
ncbi:ABC transporter permease [Stappia taiwanensis]|uniref:ABC transporter permease n=1 Tax=Stappia taiwanensis TaxID=992267 RepID=A0A838XJD5_9HYPH|nr:ABC transporter permease [Stappia taiwanensis]MBA4611439.1 ABC transporter permease [Stappia taiwanensis]GGF00275.1 peptide ABC transporter permease [Stappia taiwanensis]